MVVSVYVTAIIAFKQFVIFYEIMWHLFSWEFSLIWNNCKVIWNVYSMCKHICTCWFNNDIFVNLVCTTVHNRTRSVSLAASKNGKTWPWVLRYFRCGVCILNISHYKFCFSIFGNMYMWVRTHICRYICFTFSLVVSIMVPVIMFLNGNTWNFLWCTFVL